jgi:hypothetical protein
VFQHVRQLAVGVQPHAIGDEWRGDVGCVDRDAAGRCQRPVDLGQGGLGFRKEEEGVRCGRGGELAAGEGQTGGVGLAQLEPAGGDRFSVALRREVEHLGAVIDRLRRASAGERPLQERPPATSEFEQVVLGSEGQRGEGLAERRLMRFRVAVERSRYPPTRLAEQPRGEPIGETLARPPEANPCCDPGETQCRAALDS